MTRSIHAYVLSLAAVYCFGSLACSSSNDPSTSTGTAGATSGTAGAPGTAGATVVGAAGATTGAAGAAPGTAGAGVGGSDATAGAPGTAGAAPGTAGATGTAGGGGTDMTFTPLCAGLTTAAVGNPAPTKAGVCTAADPQLCYKTCGPQSVGFKSETCTAGAYVEQSGCSFPAAADYSCFKLPVTQDASCPAMTPVASAVCTVAPCTPCADATGHYFDSTMASKVGYCVCPAPSVAGGTSKWSCATAATAWPCPAGKGC